MLFENGGLDFIPRKTKAKTSRRFKLIIYQYLSVFSALVLIVCFPVLKNLVRNWRQRTLRAACEHHYLQKDLIGVSYRYKWKIARQFIWSLIHCHRLRVCMLLWMSFVWCLSFIWTACNKACMFLSCFFPPLSSLAYTNAAGDEENKRTGVQEAEVEAGLSDRKRLSPLDMFPPEYVGKLYQPACK